MSEETENPIIVGITGGSGSILAQSIIDHLLLKDISVIVVASGAARMVWQEEMEESWGEALERWGEYDHFTHYPNGYIGAPIASGTYPTAGMVIVPCSMTTLSAISHGFADNLIRRAADVCLKERKPLVLMPRETPLNTIHLDNMASLSRMGVTVLPPVPAFYLKPKSIEDVVVFLANRALDALNVIETLPECLIYKGSSRSSSGHSSKS